MSLDPNALTAVLTGLLSSATKDRQQRFAEFEGEPAVQEGLKAIAEGRPDRFHLMLTYPLAEAIRGVVEAALPTASEEARFLYCEAKFVERQIRAVIEQVEGLSCCADKTRTVLRALSRALVHNETIAFNYEQEYTYHLPRQVLHTHEAILAFYGAVRQMYSGRPQAYLALVSELAQQTSTSNLNG